MHLSLAHFSLHSTWAISHIHLFSFHSGMCWWLPNLSSFPRHFPWMLHGYLPLNCTRPFSTLHSTPHLPKEIGFFCIHHLACWHHQLWRNNFFLIPHPANHQLAANLIFKLFLDSVTSMTTLIHTLLISHLAHCDSSPIHTLVPHQNSCPTKWLDYLKNTNSMTFLLCNINQRLSSYKTATKLADMVKKPEVCPCPVLLFTLQHQAPNSLSFSAQLCCPPPPALHTHFCFANTSLVF